MKRKFLLIFLLLVIPLSGCGKKATIPTVKWAGKVTLRGKPIPQDLSFAVIQVRNTRGEAYLAETSLDREGNYRLDNVPQGEVLVMIHLIREKENQMTNFTPKEKKDGVLTTATEDNPQRNFDW